MYIYIYIYVCIYIYIYTYIHNMYMCTYFEGLGSDRAGMGLLTH